MGAGTGVGPRAAVSVSTLVGKGIYPIPEAARLSRVSERRIRYWLKRIDSEVAKETGKLWYGEHQPIENKVVLGFLDLQEVRFVEEFLKSGVPWRLLRAAHEGLARHLSILFGEKQIPHKFQSPRPGSVPADFRRRCFCRKACNARPCSRVGVFRPASQSLPTEAHTARCTTGTVGSTGAAEENGIVLFSHICGGTCSKQQ